MSALLTHLLVGALVALALKWEWKWVPLGMVLAELPDLDHFWPMAARVHLHNVFFAFVLPLVVFAYLVFVLGRRGLAGSRFSRPVLEIGAGTPALLGSHLVLDIVPQEPGGAHMALFYPVSGHIFDFGSRGGDATDPYTWSTLSVALVGIVALVSLGRGMYAIALRCVAPLSRNYTIQEQEPNPET